MHTFFVSVGTSLLDKGLLGPRLAFLDLRAPEALESWRQSGITDGAELHVDEAEARLSVVLAASPDPALRDRARAATLPARVEALREGWRLDGAEDDLALLPAELASLGRLAAVQRFSPADLVVLLASDSPEGVFVGRVLLDILRDHPVLKGAQVEVAWPRSWQPQDARDLAAEGAAHLLKAVDHRLAHRPRSRVLFVVTGGLKLGIAVSSQVASWPSVEGHDGLFLKLEQPGGLFFPPSRFTPGDPPVLLPFEPATDVLRAEMPFIRHLRGLLESAEPPSGQPGRTTLLLTVGAGLVRQRGLLEDRFGADSPLANPNTWRAVDEHWQIECWKELRGILPGAPEEEHLLDSEERLRRQLKEAWQADDRNALPAELASLRSLWTTTGPFLDGGLRVVLLATNTLVGEFCASRVESFLRDVPGIDRLETVVVPGWHPFGSNEGASDRFTPFAEAVLDASRDCDRVLLLPLGGIKLHLPVLTLVASRLRAPMIFGHQHLPGPVVLPWLERTGVTRLDAWPELRDFPILRLAPP